MLATVPPLTDQGLARLAAGGKASVTVSGRAYVASTINLHTLEQEGRQAISLYTA
jgi:hypothetical protein